MPRLSPFARSLLLATTTAQLGQVVVRALNCCVLVEHPYVRADPLAPENHKFSGLAIDYLHLLEAHTTIKCEKLVEYNDYFVNRTISAETDKYTPYLECQDPPLGDCVGEAIEKYGGFTGYTKYMDDCTNSTDIDCACELGVGGFSRNFERDELVDYVAPFAFDSLAVIQRREDVRIKRSDWFFVLPFSPDVWLAILSLVVVHLFVSLFDLDFPISPIQLEEDGSDDGEYGYGSRVWKAIRRAQFGARFRRAFFGTFGALLDHVSEGSGNARRATPTTRQRFLSLLAVLVGLFLVLSYEASLVNNLFSEEQVSDFTGVDMFYDCDFNVSSVSMPGSGNTEDAFWKGVVTNERNKKGCKKDAKHDAIVEEGDKILIGMQKLAAGEGEKGKGKIDFFVGPRSSAVAFEQGKFCGDLTRVGDDFFNFTVAFLLPKGSNRTQELSIATLELNRQNKIPSAIEYGTSQPCQNKKQRKLTWAQMEMYFRVSWAALGLFALFMIGARAAKWKEANLGQENNSPIDAPQDEIISVDSEATVAGGAGRAEGLTASDSTP